MTVTLFKFNKRRNSTKLPSLADGVSFSCELKDETSFINPVIKFAPATLVVGTFTPDSYNYALISYWNRYYYITDWKFLNGVWECSLTVDVLASFKTEIGATTAYIMRAASAYNGDIIDTFYPATSVKAITKLIMNSSIYRKTIPGGSFVLGVINAENHNSKVGAVTYYVMQTTELVSLLTYLFSGNIYQSSNIYEMGEGLYKSLFDPFQYIVSCMWFPYPPSAFANTLTDSSTVKVGYWNTNVTAYVVSNIVDETHYHTDGPIPNHPQITRGRYLNRAPYTTLTLFYPPFGEIPIDPSFAQYTNNYLSCIVYHDAITGVASLYVTITDGYDEEQSADYYKYMLMRTAQVGVPIQLAQIVTDYVNTLHSAGNALGSLLSLDIGGVFHNVLSAVEAAMPKLSTGGTNGSFIEIIETPLLIIEHSQLVDENITEFGRPLCANRTINTLSGYIKCGEDDHPFTSTHVESEMINKYMSDGFFYE